jgi:hypothetical protein
MKHAYLIIAHGNWEQLKTLILMLDDENNDIYIHIDAKAQSYPKDEIVGVVSSSNIQIISEYKVYWGSYELVQTELLLFAEASKTKHDYYHLLSGADLPIKPKKYIYDFFEEHKGFEFIHFDTDERLKNDHEIRRRTRLYHFFQNYRRRYNNMALNEFFTFIERILLCIQLVIGVDRMRKHPELSIRYGSQWVSITDDLVKYILSKKTLIEEVFKKTNCADELFIQTLVYNSDYKDKLYDKKYDDDIKANMRLIDMKSRGNNGNPYTWRDKDFEEIMSSDCLFARKFDSKIDKQIIDRIIRCIDG